MCIRVSKIYCLSRFYRYLIRWMFVCLSCSQWKRTLNHNSHFVWLILWLRMVRIRVKHWNSIWVYINIRWYDDDFRTNVWPEKSKIFPIQELYSIWKVRDGYVIYIRKIAGERLPFPQYTQSVWLGGKCLWKCAEVLAPLANKFNIFTHISDTLTHI